MKKIILLLFVVFSYITNAQTMSAPYSTHWQISPRIGWDIPTYSNNTPFIDYKGGLDLGVSVDYDWRRFGLGFDFDYIKNMPKSIYPTDNLFNASNVALKSFSLDENSITRMFFGIGPSYRYESKSGKFTAELNLRAGLASIKGGRTELRETTTSANSLLNFHAGYNLSSQFSAKGQVRFGYMLNERFGVHLGAYYLTHFRSTELVDPTIGIAAGYQPFKSRLIQGELGTSNSGNQFDGIALSRAEPCNCYLESVGVFAGVTFKLAPKEEECLPIYGLAVTARDKYTGELLPGTEVLVKSKTGTTVLTGKTNSFGVVVFEKMMPDDYDISGTLETIALEGTNATKKEFLKNTVVQKTIIYGDKNFIIKGKAVECNTTKPIDGISVVLEKDDKSYKKVSSTDTNGNFTLQLPVEGTYTLFGRKSGYFSQTETITASNYNREKTLFVKMEMCAEKVDCGKAIGLKNILFDLDKYVIKELAKVELNKLVRFMQDNPDVKVEVGSHTDCRSSHEYNATLSQNRANASVDYVVSQGIDRSRITGKGYGETVLLNECADGVKCSEEQHSINRRTEMKVTCPENK
jgi:outer membrane protein OmpA-like peptidoglycan-associated protein